jgi:hypothetical protein
MLVRYINRIENFARLTEEVSQLIHEIKPEKNQISCQMLTIGSENWEESIGSLTDLADQDEFSYKHIPKKLQGSVLEKLINDFNGFRTRIMIMSPRKCYSVHSDPSKRIHIPIVTNDQCWMVWPQENYCHRLLEGRSYLTDTTKPHTFFNGHSDLNRIHIVMSIKE